MRWALQQRFEKGSKRIAVLGIRKRQGARAIYAHAAADSGFPVSQEIVSQKMGVYPGRPDDVQRIRGVKRLETGGGFCQLGEHSGPGGVFRCGLPCNMG